MRINNVRVTFEDLHESTTRLEFSACTTSFSKI
jgi:hypothetical protein